MERKLLDQEKVRIEKLGELEKKKSPFLRESVKERTPIKEVIESYSKLSREELELKKIELSITGRIILIRGPFLVIQEEWETLQAYFSIKESTKEESEFFKKFLDIGDFIFLKGTLFRTQKEELTIRIKEIEIISKCLRPLPEKYLGIKDREQKIRNRVGDCLVDSEVAEVFNKRSKIIFEIRKFLNSQGYIEVETPILQSIYGGANAIPFKTEYKALKEEYFLRIAPEIPLKKMIVAGWSKIYEIGKVFRNEGIDNLHNPEFTTLEIYTAYSGLEEIMELTESIFQHLVKVFKVESLSWNGKKIPISKKFKKLFISEAIREKTGYEFYNQEITLEKSLELAERYSIQLEEFEKKQGHILHKLFEKLIEPELIEPTFVYGFHKDLSPLAKKDPNNPNFTLRTELYIGGKEFCNGFSELNDPIDQLERFKIQHQEKKKGNREAFEIDYEYIRNLEYGLPPTGGLGIGIDRVVMLFTEKNSIKDVIFFPHMRR